VGFQSQRRNSWPDLQFLFSKARRGW
jgi:hypothetical protein